MTLPEWLAVVGKVLLSMSEMKRCGKQRKLYAYSGLVFILHRPSPAERTTGDRNVSTVTSLQRSMLANTQLLLFDLLKLILLSSLHL